MQDLFKLKVKSLLDARRGGKPRLLLLELNITNACNLACLSCWQRGMQRISTRNELPDERFLAILDQAIAHGVRELRLPGSGEPMVKRKLLTRIIERAKSSGIKGLLITNGTLINKNMAALLVDTGWDNLTISIDHSDPKQNDMLRGKKGTTTKILKGIELINRAKSSARSQLPELRINTVLSSHNVAALPQLVELAAQHGFSSISFQGMTIFSTMGEKMKIRPSQAQEFNESVIKTDELAKAKGIYTNILDFADIDLVSRTNEMDCKICEQTDPLKDDPFLALPCFEPFYNMVILPEGETGPCSVFGGRGGDDCRTRSIEQIWHGAIFNGIRDTLLSGGMMEYCSQCCVPVFLETSRLREAIKKSITEQG